MSCSRCTTTCTAGAVSSIWTTTSLGLPILSRDVLRRIAAQDESWEAMVPHHVAELIKRRGFFGYIKPGRGIAPTAQPSR